MITNATQRGNTEAWADRFEADAAALEASHPRPRARLEQAKLDALRSQASDLRSELAAYDASSALHEQ